MAGQHSHCLLCRQVSCTQFADNVTACEMSTCPHCMWRFHSCKSEEHTLTCQESRVPCVNAGNGCPHFVKRSRMAQHLPVCPASVVSCGEEWCRWPMHARDQGIRHSLPSTKTYFDCGQLDVGLAMRDQRMLIDSLKAPCKLKRSLRNPLTLKYPAAPLTHRHGSLESDPRASGDTSQTVSDDETDTPWDLNKAHPGLKESIRNQLFQVTKDTTDKLATALNLTSDILIGKDKEEKRTSDIQANSQDNLVIGENTSSPNQENKDDHEVSLVQECERSSLSSERISEMSRSRSVSVLRDLGGTQLHKITGEKLLDGNDQELSLHKFLGVNLRFEVINKYVKKPTSMYTFICAQNFRRDEYKWHFKNIHEEIHLGIDGWLEQRCPLAYLGCTFTFQRFIPEQPGVVLYHSWLQESFGLKSQEQPACVPCERDAQPATALDINNHSMNNPTPQQQQQHPHQYQPSISDLGQFGRECGIVSSTSSTNSPSFVCPSELNVGQRNDNEADVSSRSRSLSHSESEQESEEREPVVSVRPVVFTSHNPYSKVLFQYNVEENQRRNDFRFFPALMGLPFEVLQCIAKHLDSFSLCNLSLTCRRLREVCCSLLDDHGIVLLDWQRQKNGDKVSWQVSNKRWMFSTSFEPIKKWRFNPNQPSVADHLKTCPFNQDCNTHDGPVKVLIPNTVVTV